LASAERPPPQTARVSLTDRCDLACVYCRPSRRDGYLDERMSDETREEMLRALVAAGIRRIRLTGGEPLLHPRVVGLVGFLASLGVEDIALTTNATLLAPLARPLREAGLHRLTISLDSLRPESFWRITRGGRLDTVLAGVDAALSAGFSELKTNTVVVRGENDSELGAIAQWAWARGITPRFIEIMSVGEGATLAATHLVTGGEMRATLAPLLLDEPWKPDPQRGPAKYVYAKDGSGRRVGFITGATETYCQTCDRLRVSSDGVLRPCLATNDGVSAAQAARSADAPGVRAALDAAWRLKPDADTWKGCTEKSAAAVSMRAIGG
jgi:cyclic pyranopterin phosphate synthase